MHRIIIIALVAFSAFADTTNSNVQLVKSWQRHPVQADTQTGAIYDRSGQITPALRLQTQIAVLEHQAELIASAYTGLTNSLQRLYAATNRMNEFSGRLYIAADMDNDPAYSNFWAGVIGEAYDTNGDALYSVHFSQSMADAPETLWGVEVESGNITYVPGISLNTNAVMCSGYECWQYRVPRPSVASNITLRTHKFMKIGSPVKPLNLAPAGFRLIEGNETNDLFTGTLVDTNGSKIVTRTFITGVLKSRTEEAIP